MTINDIETSINYWSLWANSDDNKCYDIALFKIWIQFEKYIANIFVAYATGKTSELGFKPILNLQFKDEEQLNIFLHEGNKKYIDYPAMIKKLSKHIFVNDPFEVIFLDVTNNNVYEQIIAIRNYIAHESGEAKTKMINRCFSGNDNNFKEPNLFLQTIESTTHTTYFTYYIDAIRNIVNLLADPPQ